MSVGSRAVVFRETGGSDVLAIEEVMAREPGPGEVRVRVHRSGVNPTDWKRRKGTITPTALGGGQVPNQDGAGVIEAIGADVEPVLLGRRVWVWLAAYDRPAGGTAQELTVLPAEQVVELPEPASFDLGAALGVPFMTAHRCLTIREAGPARLGPGTLDGRTVLVAGGAGAVGNAAIQLARWSGATVITTVSTPEKAKLAEAAGAQYVVNYKQGDVEAEVRRIAPDGVDIVVEVSPAANGALDAAVLAQGGSVGVYANDGGAEARLPVTPLMQKNARWQYVLLYSVNRQATRAATEDITAAIRSGAVRIGADAGLPLHHFPLSRTAEAHDAVERGTVGKVLIDVG